MVSPTVKRLLKLRRTWKKIIEKHGMVPGVEKEALERLEERDSRLIAFGVGDPVPDWSRAGYRRDSSQANGSSIAFLAEYKAGAACWRPTPIPR